MATKKMMAKVVTAELEFAFNGRKLSVSAERAEYTRLLKRFTKVAEEQRQLAADSLAKFSKDVDSFCEDGDSWAHEYFEAAADLAVEELVARGCLDVDRDTFVSEYLNTYLWDKRIGELRSLVKKLKEEEAEREARRCDRTESARHMFDDDYDDEKMMNLASAGVSGIFNAIGRGMASSEMSGKIKAKFDEDRERYLNAIYLTIRTSVDELVTCLSDKGKGGASGGVRSEEREKADKLFNNLVQTKMSADVAGKLKFEILQLDPYKQEFYDWCIQSEGDPQGELEVIAEYFGVSLERAKKDRFIKELGDCPYETEEETLEYREKAVRIAKDVRTDPAEKLSEIDAKLKEFDEKARTVEDKLFDTREEAALQRELCEFEKDLDLSDEDAALKSKRMFEDKARELGIDGGWKLKRIDKALKRFDELARTTFGLLLETRDDAKKALGDRDLFYKGIEATVRATGADSFYTSSSMPEKKIANARAAFPIPVDEYVLALTDTTLFGSGKTGLAITKWGMRWSNGSKPTNVCSISWEDFANVQRHPSCSGNCFTIADGALYANGGSSVGKDDMQTVLTALFDYCKNATFFKRKTVEELAAAEAELGFAERLERKIKSITDSGFLIGSRIPEKKRINAIKSCMVEDGDTVLAMIDSTLLGSAATAMVICDKGVYWHNKETVGRCFIPWEKMSLYKETMSVVDDRILFSQGNGFKAGITSKVNLNHLKDVFLAIGDFAAKGLVGTAPARGCEK